MANQIPEKLIDFRAYLDGTDLLGMVDATLPKLEFETEELRGAGIAGTFDGPVLGHLKSMNTEINFRTTTDSVMKLAAPKYHHITLYGALQFHDAGGGELMSKELKVVLRGLPKNPDMGKLDSGKLMEVKHTLEIGYLKIFFDKAERIEVDKFNYIYTVDGVDYLAEVRANLGLG